MAENIERVCTFSSPAEKQVVLRRRLRPSGLALDRVALNLRLDVRLSCLHASLLSRRTCCAHVLLVGVQWAQFQQVHIDRVKLHYLLE